MKKHAFLIMAHNQWALLEKLILLLDHPEVDIFLHVDKKAKGFEPSRYLSLVRFSRFTLIPRRAVHWGGRSQIRCEFDLVRAALPGKYAYYHLLSGVDLPLKGMEEILSFFDENQGKEFVQFSVSPLDQSYYSRFIHVHPFQEWMKAGGLLEKLQYRLVRLQEKAGYSRISVKSRIYGKGANWFSCTHEFLSDLASCEKELLKEFAFSRCCDEVFLQSHLLRTPFRENLFDKSFADRQEAIMRRIDWERGQPYVFRGEDLEELLSSPYLFARKFDYERHPEVVDQLFSYLSERKSEPLYAKK